MAPPEEQTGPTGNTLHAAKRAAIAAVDALAADLVALSHRIHACPELAFHEQRSSAWVVEFLRHRGFSVEYPYRGLETAFRGEAGSGEPCVAVIAEYDALPGIGHGCGHNIIAAAATGAALAVAAAAVPGRIAIIGSPAEEAGGGKALLIERGAFTDVAAALMVHPSDRDVALVGSLAMTQVEVRFHGRASHAAAAPWHGLNALDAMVTAYNAIGLLRQHIRDSARIHGIITEGGQAANIIPDEVAGSFMIRAEDGDYLDEVKEKVLNCFRAGAQATGCDVEFTTAEAPYLPLNTNPALAEAFTENMRTLGRQVTNSTLMRPASMGSTDMGNVSLVVPSLHPMIAVSPPGVPIHTAEFAIFAAEEQGDRAVLDGAKALALTAIDVLANEELRERAWRQFSQSAAR
ncbi:MAG: M20 family peptidase [Dehalococcoidia bacterium]|nr:M20 family peptidase [Dehalococcoidia bacterium]